MLHPVLYGIWAVALILPTGLVVFNFQDPEIRSMYFSGFGLVITILYICLTFQLTRDLFASLRERGGQNVASLPLPFPFDKLYPSFGGSRLRAFVVLVLTVLQTLIWAVSTPMILLCIGFLADFADPRWLYVYEAIYLCWSLSYASLVFYLVYVGWYAGSAALRGPPRMPNNRDDTGGCVEEDTEKGAGLDVRLS